MPGHRLPDIRPVGLTGCVVRFGLTLRDEANRAALAFAASLADDTPQGVEEVAVTLASTYLRFDPLTVDRAALWSDLQRRMAARDWYAADPPQGRKRLTLPASFGGDDGPALAEAAALAGVPLDRAVAALTQTPVRVQALGFAPGQPYLGPLPPCWDIPRQVGLTPQVPAGAIVVALRQFCLFTNAAPTGWRQVGRTGFCPFRAESETPFVLRPGDEVQFAPVTPEALADLSTQGPDAGARVEWLP